MNTKVIQTEDQMTKSLLNLLGANRMLSHGGSESVFYVYSHLLSRDGHGAVDSRHFATESSYNPNFPALFLAKENSRAGSNPCAKPRLRQTGRLGWLFVVLGLTNRIVPNQKVRRGHAFVQARRIHETKL